jgi:hypothetical protein
MIRLSKAFATPMNARRFVVFARPLRKINISLMELAGIAQNFTQFAYSTVCSKSQKASRAKRKRLLKTPLEKWQHP